MKNLTKIAAAVLAASTLTACVEEGATRSEPTGMSQASSGAWDRGCSDAKVGSYDRSSHSSAYEEGWQSCKKQQEQSSSTQHSKHWERGCSDAKVGSYDRSKHSADYEAGWQACKKG